MLMNGKPGKMRLLKPAWVSHDGKPIFSIDIHPDGSRFATGGQGDNSGKVVIWNMAPVRDERVEKNENIPKMLCTMDNHLACVNCVRWSHSGRYLASCGDDKLIMIWQNTRQSGPSTVFGSDGSVVNVEHWRCLSTLRAHNGDVLGVSWSHDDRWLASCSIDNTVCIWNAYKFPEQVTVLRGHTGLVKGVTWDPIGKYLASQSDDKTLRVWRTLDWQQEECVTEPFQECGGTTHVLRLGWSPDGYYIVSAHAMNNSGPTAQIIQREGWRTQMDFVGHRKAVTVVRFNPNLFRKKMKKTSEKATTYSCCALGSRDCSLSIWSTALKRPLTVIHDLFEASILDMSWDRKGTDLLCCSWDGTIAYLKFSLDEIGAPLTSEELHALKQRTYGKAMPGATAPSTQIIESTELLDLHQNKENNVNSPLTVPELKVEEVAQTKEPAPRRIQVMPVIEEKPSLTNGESKKLEIHCSKSNSSNDVNKQIETKTKDGRRRITPIFLESQPIIGEAPLPFDSDSRDPIFSTSTETSKIVREIKDRFTPPLQTGQSSTPASQPASTGSTPPKPSFSSPTQQSGTSADKPTDKTAATTPPSQVLSQESKKPDVPSTEKTHHFKERVRNSEDIKRKLDASLVSSVDSYLGKKRGRPKKDRSSETIKPPVTPQVAYRQPIQEAAPQEPRIIYATSGLDLTVPTIEKPVSVQIAGAIGADNATVLDLENYMQVGTNYLHRFRCSRGGRQVWEGVVSSKILAAVGNSYLVCLACKDQSINLFSTTSGLRLFPCMVLGSKISVLKCCGHYVMAITSKGMLHVWNTQKMAATIKNESLVGIIPDNDTHIVQSLLTDQGLPIISLSNGCSYTFRCELGCWVLLSSMSDSLHMCSDHQSAHPENSHNPDHPKGILETLQVHTKKKVGRQAQNLFSTSSMLQQPATLSHIENQLACCLAIRSGSEYRFWFMTYVRYLVQEGCDVKLRAVCDDLLGPLYKSKTSSWEPTILGMSKRKLLEEILPSIGANLQLQRLYTEYQQQMQASSS